MNRKKKINSIHKSRMKKMNAKNNPRSKPKYISKAERAKLDALDNDQVPQNENVLSE